MRASEVAKLAGVSTDTLRHYERKGLLPAVPRTGSGYREYSPATIDRVQLIRRALAIGFSLADLAKVLRQRDRGGVPCRQVHALVASRLAGLDDEIASLVTLKGELETLLADWTRKLDDTPPDRQARLLDTLPGRATAIRGRRRF